MIAYMEGRLLERTEETCVLVTQAGIGYEIHIGATVNLPEKGGAFALYIAHVIREDAEELFGFTTWDERLCFEVLLTINRVGARTALSILSTFTPDDLRRLALEDDPLALTRVPGIGKKSAQQIFLDLKYKLAGSSVTLPPLTAASSVARDALTGLTNLGYSEEEVRPVLTDVLTKEPDLDVSAALRTALKLLAKSK